VDEHSCKAGDKTWMVCRLNYPRCIANYPSDQLLFGFAGVVVTIVDILGRLDRIMVDEIGNQCYSLAGNGPLRN
jgi:hypothetical protein